jgi:hypothetical protein
MIIILIIIIINYNSYVPLAVLLLFKIQCYGSVSHLIFGRLGPDSGEQKLPTQKGKSEEISCFEVLDVLFRGLETFPVA